MQYLLNKCKIFVEIYLMVVVVSFGGDKKIQEKENKNL